MTIRCIVPPPHRAAVPGRCPVDHLIERPQVFALS
jgi:hypothetical protein